MKKKVYMLPSPSYTLIRIPRTASTSICQALGMNTWHETAEEKKTKYGIDWNNIFKFTIVRDPIDRFLSAFYFMSIFNGDGHRDANKFLATTDLVEFCKNDFNNFILRPQTDYVLDEKGTIIVDYIGRYETLDDSWKHICEVLQCECVPLPVIGKSQKKNDLTPESIALLKEFYKRDYNLLNY